MGHFLFFMVHLFAFIYMGNQWLLLTIPLHLIYSAIQRIGFNSSSQSNLNLTPKTVKSRLQPIPKKAQPVALKIIGIMVSSCFGAYLTFIISKIIYNSFAAH